jgi:DNA-directed RNA polymerase subunit RPC12/RpoP
LCKLYVAITQCSILYNLWSFAKEKSHVRCPDCGGQYNLSIKPLVSMNDFEGAKRETAFFMMLYRFV